MEAQKTYEDIVARKEMIRVLSAEVAELGEKHFEKYGDCDVPVIVDGEQKFFRVYKPEGKFVYNTLYETGLRDKPQNLWEGK